MKNDLKNIVVEELSKMESDFGAYSVKLTSHV